MPRIRFRAITPKRAKLLDSKIVRQEIIREGIDDAKRQAINMAKATVRTWKGKPTFKGRFFATADQIGVDVTPQGPNAQKWIWLTLGTRKKYPIPKSGRRLLRFRAGYRAKTRVRVIGSRGGGSFGPTVFAQRVIHPGIKAREFEKEMARRLRKRFKKRVERALRRAARRSQS